MFEKFDIIVVGAGHAGCEAAVASANLGSKTLLITMNLDTIAQMSCNPAMGGIAKGQLIREIDALGGQSAIVTDKTMLQFRMLNRSKGPAMWSPRAQSDKKEFTNEWKRILENTKNLYLWQDSVIDIIFEQNKVAGVITKMNLKIFTKALILTNGTFLNGLIHIGEVNYKGGRIGEPASEGITKTLVDKGFVSERLKTGTPVRIDGRTVDFEKLVEQKGDEGDYCFSFRERNFAKEQMSCYLAYTSLDVHNILKKGFDQSPLFMGRIQGIGPRYCPSIEDKIQRFFEKQKHQLFLEPEGRDTNSYYLNGFSSSLPIEIQYEALKKIDGFHNVSIIKPGYAIEYDFFQPTQLYHTLETKLIENLYFAGQINGTTGYEEAAAQGLMAGINAHHKINNKEKIILKRTEAYIGVLIDDLINKGVDEPYRMFTSRAEYRILLRQDNADERIAPIGYKIGLIDEHFYNNVLEKYSKCKKLFSFLNEQSIEPIEINNYLTNQQTPNILQKTKLRNVLLRPQIDIKSLILNSKTLSNYIIQNNLNEDIIEETEILLKYESYIIKESEMANKISKYEDINLSETINYFEFESLSWEAREKLNKIKPSTIGQAARISGISPSDISVLLIYFGR